MGYEGMCVCRCVKVLATHCSACVDDVEYLEMRWCMMHGHVIECSEMVDMCAENFGVWEHKGVEDIRMVLKTSKVCKCQNMRKCGSMCVEWVHTHHWGKEPFVDTHCTGMNVKVWNKGQVPQENPKTPNTHTYTLHTHYHNLSARVWGLWYWKISLVS